MLPRISASTEADPLQHTLRNVRKPSCSRTGSGPPQPPQHSSPQGGGCPSLPNRTTHPPHGEGSSQGYREGCRPQGDRLLYQFPMSELPTSSQHNWYKILLFLHYRPSTSYPFPMACIQHCKLTFCDKYGCAL